MFPLAAWMVVRFGARQPLLWSVCLLIGASAAAGLTASLELLVVWRAAQGTLGAVLLVAGQAALFAMFPPGRQGFVQAAFALSIVIGPTAVAPALQGWITDTLSWSWIFILNLPIGALGLLAILGGIDAVPDERRPARFDAVGLALLAVAMACLVFVLQEGSRYDWFEDAGIVHLSVFGTAALLLFIGWEIRTQGRGALVDFAVFRDEHFSYGFLVSFVAGFALFGSAFVIPAFALQVLSLTPTHAGLLLLPGGALVGLGLLTAGSLIQLKGVAPFKLVPIGILCFMTAMWMLSHSTVESGAPDMTPALLLRGLGLGVLFVSLTMVTLAGLKGPLNSHGVALFNFGRQFGGLIGIAFLLTYLDHQVALNRSVLSINLTPGSPWLAERQAAAAELLAGRGYNPDEAMGAAVALFQGQVQQQVAVLSFNEVFLAVALLFVVAVPVLITAKLILGRVLAGQHHGSDA